MNQSNTVLVFTAFYASYALVVSLFYPFALDPEIRSALLLVILIVNSFSIPKVLKKVALYIAIVYVLTFLPVFWVQVFPGSLVSQFLSPQYYFGRFAGVTQLPFTGSGDTSAYGLYLSTLQMITIYIIISNFLRSQYFKIFLSAVLFISVISAILSGNRWTLLVLVLIAFCLPKFREKRPKLFSLRRLEVSKPKLFTIVFFICLFFVFLNFSGVINSLLLDFQVFDSEAHLQKIIFQRLSLDSIINDFNSDERAFFVGDWLHYKESVRYCFKEISTLFVSQPCGITNYIDNGFLWLIFKIPVLQSMFFFCILLFHLLCALRKAIPASGYRIQLVFVLTWCLKGPHPFSIWALLSITLIGLLQSTDQFSYR